MNIEGKIQKIIKEVGNSIVVLKGFDQSEYPDEKKRYSSFRLGWLEQIDFKVVDEMVINEVVAKRHFDDDYQWMTIEEFQMFEDALVGPLNQMPVVVLNNNLYSKQYPYSGTLANVGACYHNLYNSQDTDLTQSQQEELNSVEKFYGSIDYSNQSDCYYVTYPELKEEIPTYDFFDIHPVEIKMVEDYPTEDAERIELSEDEIPFLDLETKILTGTNQLNLVFVLSGSPDSLPNKYLERINLLRNIGKFRVFFTSLSIRRHHIENEAEYKAILKDVWGYPDFNDIRFYKHIDNRSKEMVLISQAQIIDDIVIQAEKAIKGEPFRDVYITAATGAGKSVMFQIPALYLAKKYHQNKPLTLVISPLIGLMNDQVDSMRAKGVNNYATINGNVPLYEKQQIIEKVQNKEIDVLYLSPETLQARSDIKMLIGDRKIGCVIIDEAHIVTTWGKSFRADYWYLGIYLAKLRKEYKFPIVTFTATAIYGGREDMYLDTRNSLNMISPISYFGEVRRDDLFLNVHSSEKDFKKTGQDYRRTKDFLALKHLKHAKSRGEKTLMYFPTVRLLNSFYMYLEQNATDIAEKTGRYFGTLQKEHKDEVLAEFKNGNLEFVLATKAFGMGIDIPDITNIYHYAPTGNVVDYVQEIGRAARDKKKVKYGFGLIDFLPRDMNEVERLHGMSAIRKSQIIEVMKKIRSVYLETGRGGRSHSRNLIISSEDFKYIFDQDNHDIESEESKQRSLDNKLKTVLLMIEKDFSSPRKLGYSPFVARPRSLFGNDLIFVDNQFEQELVKSRLSRFFKKAYTIQSKHYTSVYQVNLSGIWEQYYQHMSYPSFKYALFNEESRQNLKHKNLFNKFQFASGIVVTPLGSHSNEDLLAEVKVLLNKFEEFANEQKMSGNQFTVNNLGQYFVQRLHIADKFEARAVAQAVINSAFEFQKIKSIHFIKERSNSGMNDKRYVLNNDVDIFTHFILSELSNTILPDNNYIKQDGDIITFYHRSSVSGVASKTIALGIGETRRLLGYQVLGGNTPQIYVRMNSVSPLDRAIKKGEFYKNNILSDVQMKHYTSVAMLKYLFNAEQPEKDNNDRIRNYSKWFWDNIESYFMGVLPDKVKAKLTR